MAKIERLHDSGTLGKAATRLAVTKTGAPLRVATVSAIATGLRVSYWTSSSTGTVSLTGTQTLDHVTSQFDAALIGGPVVVAYRNAVTHELRVVSFNLNDVPGATAGVIDDKRLAVVRQGFGTSWFVAYSDGGELRVQLWEFTGSGDDPVPALVASSGDQAGGASHICAAWCKDALVTAVRTGGSLKLIRWSGSQDGIERLGNSGNQAGALSELAVCGFSGLDQLARNFIVTALKNGSGNLELISWQANSSGDIDRLHSSGAGAIDEVAITGFDLVAANNLGVFVTAVKNGSGNLELISWRIHDDGAMHRLASASAGAAEHIAIQAIDEDIVATTCIDGSGQEKVITWRITQNGPAGPPPT